MKVSKEFTVITIVDKQGNSWMGAVGDIDRDLLQVHGLQLADGSSVSFRANIAGIIEQVTATGLRCNVIKRNIEVKVL